MRDDVHEIFKIYDLKDDAHENLEIYDLRDDKHKILAIKLREMLEREPFKEAHFCS